MDQDLKSIFYAFIITWSFFRGHGTINGLIVSVTATKSKIYDSNHSPTITTSDIISKKNYFVLEGSVVVDPYFWSLTGASVLEL
jgi:hypothetical protein